MNRTHDYSVQIAMLRYGNLGCSMALKGKSPAWLLS